MSVAVIKGASFAQVYDSVSNGVAENDVRSGSTKLHSVTVDNSGNAEIVFFKAFDSLLPVEATTEPELLLAVAASKSRTFPIHPGTGMTFATGLSFLTTSKQASDEAQTAPAAPVLVTLETDA